MTIVEDENSLKFWLLFTNRDHNAINFILSRNWNSPCITFTKQRSRRHWKPFSRYSILETSDVACLISSCNWRLPCTLWRHETADTETPKGMQDVVIECHTNSGGRLRWRPPLLALSTTRPACNCWTCEINFRKHLRGKYSLKILSKVQGTRFREFYWGTLYK